MDEQNWSGWSNKLIVMDPTHSSLDFPSALHLLLNTLAITHLTGHYSVCVIRGYQDDIRLEIPGASLHLLMEESWSSDAFECHLIRALNAGCEGFVVTGTTVLPFLDHFRSAHEAAFYRASNKRIIAVTSLDPAERDRLISHDAMEVTPNILFIVPNATNETVELYTTNLLPAAPRGKTVELVHLDQIVLGAVFELPDTEGYFPDKLNDMQGRPVRLSTIPYPPFSMVSEVPLGQGNARSLTPTNFSLQADGTEVLMFVELCRRRNCTLEIDVLPSSDWGQVYSNGSADGLIATIVNRQVDATAAAIYRWYNWYDHVWQSAYTGRSGVSMFVVRPRLLPHWQTPFLTFPPSLWLMVSVTFCAGTTAVFITERYRHRMCLPAGPRQRYRLVDAIFFMISLYVEQSAPLHHDLVAGTILLCFLLFGGFMIGNSYAGALSCVMTVPRYERSIDTRADFAALGMRWAGTSIMWMSPLMMSELQEDIWIREKYTVYDEPLLLTFSHTRRDLGYVHERLQYGTFGMESFIDLDASRMLQPLKEDIFWEHVITACSKTWPLMGLNDELILRVHQSGILRYWEQGSTVRNTGQEIQRNLANARTPNPDREPVKLLIAHFLGVFFILFVGLFLATITFVAELLVHRSTRKR